MKKYYTLCTLNKGLWYPQFGDYNKDVVKQEQADSYSDCKCKIITTDGTQNAIDKRIAEMNIKPTLNPYKYSEIINTIDLMPDYKHCNLFDNKQDAITHVGNFTSWQTKNKVNGRYTTSLNAVIVNEQIKWLTVFSLKV